MISLNCTFEPKILPKISFFLKQLNSSEIFITFLGVLTFKIKFFYFIVIDDEDEKTITQGALVTLVVNLKRLNLKVLFNNDETQKIKPIENGEDGEDGVESSDLVVADGETLTEGSSSNSTKVAAPEKKPWKDTSNKKKPKKPNLSHQSRANLVFSCVNNLKFVQT